MKICKICGKQEPEVEFYASNGVTCKECVKERAYQNKVKRESAKAEREGRTYNPTGHRPKCPKELEGKGFKYCNECKQWLPLSEFGWHYKAAKTNRYINSVCKKCASLRTQRVPNRAENISRNNEIKKARLELDEEYRQYCREIDKKYRHSERGIIMSLLNGARKRAGLYNLDFDLTPEDIIIPETCPILGLKLGIGKVGGSDNSPSLDRIDSTKGYVKGNVQVISKLANSMKNSADTETLKKFADYINSEK